MSNAVCDYKPCDKAVHARSLCQGHYRLDQAGEPLRPLRKRAKELPRSSDLIERIRHHTRQVGECQVWTSRVDVWGTAVLTYERKHVNARRELYELEVGPIPKGRRLLRQCETDLCISPGHQKVSAK